MIYAKDHGRDSNYRSVNTLIQPKKRGSISASRPVTVMKESQDLETTVPLAPDLPQDEMVQAKSLANGADAGTIQMKETPTGLPDGLKAGVENLSGFSMDQVRVHYDSPQPAQLQALAYTQGTDIHLGPGQKQHLPHEAWHVAQQMQGRVKPTMQMNGLLINDNSGMEHEAELMGNKIAQFKKPAAHSLAQNHCSDGVFQLKKVLNLGSGTKPENLFKSDTVIRDSKEKDTVLNVDSGHMLLANILMDQPLKLFTTVVNDEKLEIKYQTLMKMTGAKSKEQVQETKEYREFVIRDLYAKYSGKANFFKLLQILKKHSRKIPKVFRETITKLESPPFAFQQGFVEDHSAIAPAYRYQGFDEVHIISALGFDVIKDKANLKELARLLKTGSKLIITAEKTGMVQKALEMEKKFGSPYETPVIDEQGNPKIKSGLEISGYFDYSPKESAIGTYAGVFKKHYQGIESSHTTGKSFTGNQINNTIPWVRLVFIFRGNVYDLDLARHDYEGAQSIDPKTFGNMDFEEFLSDYRQY